MQLKPLKNVNAQICQICGDIVGLTESGDVFVACNECAFFRFVGHATSTRGETEIKLALNARLDTKDTKVG